MKKYLIIFLILPLIATIIPTVNAGSPGECIGLLLTVLKKQNPTQDPKVTYETIINDQKALQKFKDTAVAQGDWGKFMPACTNPHYNKCKVCDCPPGLEETNCSWNCGCCWGGKDTRCRK